MLTLLSLTVSAQILDYQILRLVAMKSECQRDEIQREVSDKGGLLFRVSCQNVSHYPEGLQIGCPDAHNERSCKLLNRGREFKQLHLLQGTNN